MRLSDIGEFGLIEQIRQATTTYEGVKLGIGDDCAAVTIPPGELLLTSTDLLLESVHFRLDWTDWFQLGRKCVSVNVSDIAAMGGTPRHIVLGLGLSRDHALTDIEQLLAGVHSAAADYDVSLIGGDTCRSPGPLFLSLTVQGSLPPDEMVTRSGAQAGDNLYVTGTLGDSGLALSMLQRGEQPPSALAKRHHDPVARVAIGRELARRKLATAMLDISDGLLGDLEHLLTASQVGIKLDESLLPLSSSFAKMLSSDPGLFELALNGGEDYELLFSAPIENRDKLKGLATEMGLSITRIGTLTNDPTTRQRTGRNGQRVGSSVRGYNHFCE